MSVGFTVICQIIFTYICGIYHRFPCKKIVCSHPSFFILTLKFHSDRHVTIFEMFLDFLKEIKLFGSFLIHTCSLGYFCNSSFKNFDIRENQLKIDRFDISKRINASVYMDDIWIFEAAYYMYDCIYFTDICKELVAEAFTLGCTLYQTCDINKFDNSRCHLLRVVKIPEQFQSFIRNSNHADVRVDGTERVVCGFCACFCQ